MELRQCRSFLKIVELQSFSKAAEALGYSQSALSVQIRSLEKELDVRLFDRMGHSVKVTLQGERLARRLIPILQEIQEVKDTMQHRPPTEDLHVGMIQSLCQARMANVMQYFTQNYPSLHITVTLDSPRNLLEALNHNQVDLVYVVDQPIYDIKWVKVMEVPEDIVFVGSKDSPLVWRKEVPLLEIISQRFFLTEKKDNYRHSLDQYLAARQLSVKPFLEIGDTAFILDLVRQNLGVSFLPRYVIENSAFREWVKIINVKDFSMHLYRQLFYHKDKWLTPGMRAFLNLVPQEERLKNTVIRPDGCETDARFQQAPRR